MLRYTAKEGKVLKDGEVFLDYNPTHSGSAVGGSDLRADNAAIKTAAKLNERTLRVDHDAHEPYCQMITATDPRQKVCTC